MKKIFLLVLVLITSMFLLCSCECKHKELSKADCTTPQKCLKCDASIGAALGHTDGAWITDKEPTCTEDGSKHQVCSVCNATIKTETLTKLDHTEVVDAAVAPTCTTDGKTEGKHCSVCNEVLVAQTVVNKLGHTEVIDADVAPTCTADGKTEGKHCSVCNVVLVAQTVVNKLGHTEVVDIAVAPTCTTDGKTEGKHCSVCNEVLIAQTVVGKLGHTEVTDVAIAPTCTTEGKTEGKHCSVCNEIFVAQETIEARHNYVATIVNRDCGNNAKKVYTCADCHHSYNEEIDSIGLEFNLTSVSSATMNGYGRYQKYYEITTIGGYGIILLKYELFINEPDIYPTSIVDFTSETSVTVSFTGYADAIDNYVYKITAKDEAGNISIYRFSLKDESLINYEHKGEIEHTFSDWSVTKESTCSEYGEKQSVCSVCNNTITDIVEKKPHTVAVDEAIPSNCMQTGLTEGSHCAVCETVIVAQTETPAGEHSYENKICICGRDVSDEAIATYDLSKNQDGSIIAYLTNTNSGQKVYILGNGEMKNYLNYGTNVSPFKENKSIIEVYIGEGITSISDYLFYFCTNLRLVNIPQSTTYIGSSSFIYCSLCTVTLPKGLTRIEHNAFNGNFKLTNLIFPESLEYIGTNAFTNCNITSIYIPKNVSYIGVGAFSYNNEIYKLTVDKNNITYHSSNNCLINTATKTLISGCKNSIIPADGSVTCIDEAAFAGCEFISFIIPDCIVEIRTYAFIGCDFIQIVIPISVNKIDSNAFLYCYSLTTIYCEVSSQPSNWSKDWDRVDAFPDKYVTVVWGYSK